jgi:hypothetical protein
MRKYFYYKQDKLKPEGIKVEKTEPEILDSYWDIWYDKLSESQQFNPEIVNAENCIKDWVEEYKAEEIL